MLKEITLSSRISPSKQVLFRELQEEAVLLHLESGVYFGLNPLGTRIWQLLQQTSDLDQVFNSLVKEYEVTPGRAKEDLLQLTQTLHKNGLVEITKE